MGRGARAAAAALLLSQAAGGQQAGPRRGRLRQSVCRWCYATIPLEQLCGEAGRLGLTGVDLLQPEEYAIPARSGLICTMGYAAGGGYVAHEFLPTKDPLRGLREAVELCDV